MATSKKFSELPVASSMNNGDLFAVAQEDAQAETGYTSKSATALVVGKKLNGEIEYATDLPSFPPGDQNPLDALEYLNSKINDLYPVDSATGAIVNFTTSLALPLVALKTNIVAQGGGGTPSAPVAITGFSQVNVYRRGGNLWDEEWEGGTYITSDGRPATSENAIRSKTKINIKPNVNFAFYNSTANAQIRLYYYDRTETFLSYTAINANNSVALFTTPANAYYMNFAVGNSVTPVTTNNNNLSVNYPNTDTAYHAYNPQSDTFTLSLGQTIYGGSLDVKDGIGKNILGEYDLGNYTWRYSDATSRFYTSDIANLIKGGTTNALCSIYVIGATATDNNTFQIATNGYLYIKNTDYTDPTAFKNAMTGIKIYIELATPIPFSVTPAMPSTIEGSQNWFADSGDIELEYKMGIQEYIDKKIAEVQALIL